MKTRQLLITTLACLAMLLPCGAVQADTDPAAPESTTAQLTLERELTAAELAADAALEMLGIPYKYRGESPKGFDCSGLVKYSFGIVGIDLPHGTRELRRITAKLAPKTELQKGDLLFFNERRRRSSHVGIYLGDGIFVHAPRRREHVRVDNLSDRHWKKRFSEARRIS